MFYLFSNKLTVYNDNIANDIKKSKTKVEILNEFNNSNKSIPDKDLHNHSIAYYPKFNEILSISSSNYLNIDTRDTEYLYLELISFWEKFFKKNKIFEVQFKNLLICPFSFSLFVFLKFNNIKFTYKKQKADKFNKIYKIDKGKFINISYFDKIALFFKNIIQFSFYIKLQKLTNKNNLRTKNQIIFDFDKLEQLIYFDEYYLNFTQFLDLKLDLQSKKNIELIFFKKQILMHKYKKIINSYSLYMIKNRKNLKITIK